MNAQVCQKAANFILAALALSVLAIPGFAFISGSCRELPPPSPWFRVGPLSAIPDDGIPRRFPLLQSHRDAWTRLPDTVQGHVFLRRLPGAERPLAYHTHHWSGVCLIAVIYEDDRQTFRSECRGVRFDLNGKLMDADRDRAVSEDIEQLRVDVRGGEVFVEFDRVSRMRRR